MSYCEKHWLQVSEKTPAAVGEAALEDNWVDGEDYCDEEGNIDFEEIGAAVRENGDTFFDVGNKIYFVQVAFIEEFKKAMHIESTAKKKAKNISNKPYFRVAANHIIEKGGFIHFGLFSPRCEIWGNYPVQDCPPPTEFEGVPVYGDEEPAYLCAYKDVWKKLGHSVLASGDYNAVDDYEDRGEECIDWHYEPQVQGMNAKQVARFVHLFNLLFCRVPVEKYRKLAITARMPFEF